MPGIASAHRERPVTFPSGTGKVPEYRSDGPYLLVCKRDAVDFQRRISGFPEALREFNNRLFTECMENGYEHLQQAVDRTSQSGIHILMLPGLYREDPSLGVAEEACARLATEVVLLFEQQMACRHVQNLVAIFGIEDLQIEGTGAGPDDVVIDAAFQKLNAVRADRANGFYVRNLTVQRSLFNGLYILETDGFVIDRVAGRWNDEYGFLTFASDHGLYTSCEAYGNGDAGIYPGGTSDINRDRGFDVERYAIEIKDCRSHHNTLGLSGTAGNSVYAHDNRFDSNATGISLDSAYPDHPGLPQNHVRFERNLIHANNVNYFRYVSNGTCRRPYAERGYEQGVVCPALAVPVGTGVVVAGGNYNLFQDNWVYDNGRAGFMQFWVPAFVRAESSIEKQFDTSHFNRYLRNRLGVAPNGEGQPNRVDYWWDRQGEGNCWDAGSEGIKSDPSSLSGCDSPSGWHHRYMPDFGNLANLASCAMYDRQQEGPLTVCDWLVDPPARGELRLGWWLLNPALIAVLTIGLLTALHKLRYNSRGTS